MLESLRHLSKNDIVTTNRRLDGRKVDLGSILEEAESVHIRICPALSFYRLEVGNNAMLAMRETYWQHQLRAYKDNGGNGMCIKKEDG